MADLSNIGNQLVDGTWNVGLPPAPTPVISDPEASQAAAIQALQTPGSAQVTTPAVRVSPMALQSAPAAPADPNAGHVNTANLVRPAPQAAGGGDPSLNPFEVTNYRGPSVSITPARHEDKFSADTHKQLNQVDAANQQMVQDNKTYGRELASVNAGISGEQEQMARRHAADTIRHEQAGRQDLERRQAEIDAHADEIAKTRLVGDDRTGLQKGLGVLAAAFGGALQGLTNGSRNTAIDAINSDIDRRIATQKAQYQINRDSLEAQRSAYGQAVQRLGNTRAAEELAHAAELKVLMAKGETMKNQLYEKWGDPAINDRWNAIQLELNKDKMGRVERADHFTASQRTAVGAKKFVKGIGWVDANLVDKAALDAIKDANQENIKQGGKGGEAMKGAITGLTGGEHPLASAIVEGRNTAKLVKENPIDMTERVTRAALPKSWATKVFSQNTNARAQAVQQAKLTYRNAITGSGGSEKEAAEIEAAFDGAGDQESLERTVDWANKKLETRKNVLMANLNPSQRALLESQLGGSRAAPASQRKGF